MASTTNLGVFRIAAEVELEVHICGTCGVTWGLTTEFITARRNDHKGWVCPNGHSWVFHGPTEEQKLRNRLAERERALTATQDLLNAKSAEAEHAKAQARGYKGALVKTTKRIVNGVCPLCQRSFPQLAGHMASKHPAHVEAARSEPA